MYVFIQVYHLFSYVHKITITSYNISTQFKLEKVKFECPVVKFWIEALNIFNYSQQNYCMDWPEVLHA